jgi:hypothetical protein
MKMRLSLTAVIAVGLLLAYALYSKGDVKAAFKTPFMEFSLDAHDRAGRH